MDERRRNVARTTRRLALAAALMFGFGFALVPLYNVLCQAVGLNGKSATLTAVASTDVQGGSTAPGRAVTVEFVANTNGGLDWEFRPAVARMTVRLGDTAEALFVARNRDAQAVTGQAIPSVAPGPAAKHFHKIECFCFTQQTLAAGERKDMKVRFRIDPDLAPDVNTVTLGYTFFDLHKAPPDGHEGHPAAGS